MYSEWIKKERQQKPVSLRIVILSDPAGARTQDPNIKSVVLYQLSYGINAEICASPGARTLDPNIKSVVLYQLS